MPSSDIDARISQLYSVLGLNISGQDEKDLFRGRSITVEAGDTIVFEGQGPRRGYLVCSGWACSVRHLIEGSDQVLDVRMPGDLIGIADMKLSNAPYATEAITAVELVPFSFQDFVAASGRVPHLAEAFLFAMNCDAAMLVEHMVGIARRKPQPRTAHFLLELSERVARVGLGNVDRFHCPLSQYLLADLLGLTAVHMNRTLRHLREMGFVSFRNSMVTIHDRPGMIAFSGFDPAYLNQTQSRHLTAPDGDLLRHDDSVRDTFKTHRTAPN